MTNEQTREQFLIIWNSNGYINLCTSDDMRNAINALEKQIPKHVISEGNDESDWVYCPCCNEILGVNESVYNAFWDNNWKAIYCHKCGQALTWEEK
jgi:hypothetical protein